MICDDCIHLQICNVLLDGFERDKLRRKDVENPCKYFQDKNKFIELPCKIGDKYYTIRKTCSDGGYATKGEHFPCDSDCEGCCEQCDKSYVINEYTFDSAIGILKKETGIGTYYYLTKYEAEQKLNKMKS